METFYFGLSIGLIALTLVLVNSLGYVNMIRYVMEEPSECTKLTTHPVLTEIEVQEHWGAARRLHPLSYKYHLYSYVDANASWRAPEGEQAVVFLPGSRGYHTNLQWLASYMQTVFRNRYFDFYTIRYNEETSFMSGEVVESAAEFTCHALKTLRERRNYSHPALLIGHSMGGTIARYVPLVDPCVGLSPLQPTQSDRDVLSIVTFSGANRHPPTSWDGEMISQFHWMNSVYRCSDPYFSSSGRLPDPSANPYISSPSRGLLEQFVPCSAYRSASDRVRNVTVIAVAGGRKDVVIESSNLLIDEILGPQRGMSFHMNFIPNVSSTLDHHAIVSCSWWIESFCAALIDVQNRVTYNSTTVLEVMKRRFLPPVRDSRKYFYALYYGFTYEEKDRLRVTEPFTYYTLEYTNVVPSTCIVMAFFCFLRLLSHPESSVWDFLLPGRVVWSFLSRAEFLLPLLLAWALRALLIACGVGRTLAEQIPSVGETCFLFLSGMGLFYLAVVACLLMYLPGFIVSFLLPFVPSFFPHMCVAVFVCRLVAQCVRVSAWSALLYAPVLLDFLLVSMQLFYASQLFYQPLGSSPLVNKFYGFIRFFLIAPQLPRLYNLNMRLRTPVPLLRVRDSLGSLENAALNALLALAFYLLWRYESVEELLQNLDVFPMRLLVRRMRGANKGNEDIYHTAPFMTPMRVYLATTLTIYASFLSLQNYNYLFVYLSAFWFSCLSYAYVERKCPKLLYDLRSQKGREAT